MNAKIAILLSAMATALSLPLFAATTITWKGGVNDNLSTTANWDPETVPSSQSSIPYIAEFSDVTLSLTNSAPYWYPAGITVKGSSSSVEYKGNSSNNRCMPTTAFDSDEFVVDVEAGSSFKFNGTIFYGDPRLKLVKRGGGTFNPTGWCGNTSETTSAPYGRWFSDVCVEGGTMISGGQTICVSNSIVVSAGAVLQIGATDGIHSGRKSSDSSFLFYPPVVRVEGSGVIDCVARAQHFTSIAGDGVITNLHKNGITVTLLRSGETFSGKIYGKLKVEPIKGITPQGAYMVIGSQETLADADFSITDVEGCDIEVKFAPGIGRFYTKSFPTDRKFYDTDGKEVVLVKGRDWFVDCSRTASGDGKTPETAFASLPEAMSNPALVSGNTVFALPGWYTNGTMVTSAGSVQTNRVVVPAGVTLASTGGAAETFIVGSPATSPFAGMDGCGTGAVRCVYLNLGAVLRGFTVTNGYTYCKATNSGENGGGVLGGTIEDCIIVGCVGTRGGGASESVCKRCLFKGNVGAYIGSGLNKGEAYNCVFSGHVNGNYVALYSSAVNCTFLSDNSVLATWYNKDDLAVYAKNCLFLHKSAGRDQANFSHCVFTSDSVISDANIGEGSMKKAVSEMGVKADGRPRKGSCIVDAGDNALYPSDVAGDLDFLNSQRIYNETIDIGAYEWKPSDKGLLLLFR